jgi:hypothetical protein
LGQKPSGEAGKGGEAMSMDEGIKRGIPLEEAMQFGEAEKEKTR